MSGTVQVKGLAELQKIMQLLPVQLETNVLRGALYAGAKVIRDEAKRLAPVAPPTAKNRRLYKGYAGALRDSIRAGAMVDRKAGKVMAYIRAGSHGKTRKGKGADAYYARWVEFGTAAHLIVAKGKNAGTLNRRAKRRGLKIGDVFVGPSVKHPGSKPRPFMRPAFDTKAREAVVAAGLYIRKRLATKHGLTQAEAVEIE
jgi:HK97 gp10 family phage protein